MKIGIGFIGAGKNGDGPDENLDDMQIVMIQRMCIDSITEYLADYYSAVQFLKFQGYSEDRAKSLVERAMTKIRDKFDVEVLPTITERNEIAFNKTVEEVERMMDDLIK